MCTRGSRSAGAMVLLREITFNPELDQLVFTPLKELESLRSGLDAVHSS